MQLLELTLAEAADNLALDEALLEIAETGERPCEVLRLWEPPQPMVVVGRSSRWEQEVRLEACQRRSIPVLRRASGGLSIVTGPGCLMFSLIVSYDARPEWRKVDRAHQGVLGPLAETLARLLPGVALRGTSDLAWHDKKFSGNSLRCRRNALLYHGTLMYDFDLACIEALLRFPPRTPNYRAGRTHTDFVTNLPLSRAALREAVLAAWPVTGEVQNYPCELTAQIVRDKYSLPDWQVPPAK
jgi:lipoate-protein ligase A